MRPRPPKTLWFSTLDWFVDDAHAAATKFAEVFSLPEIRDDWLVLDPEHGYDAVFSRTGDALTAAPTRLEFLAVRHDDDQKLCAHSPYGPVSEQQAPRDQRVHATVLAVDDIDNAVDWMAATGVGVRVEEPCEHLPFPRIWIGWDGDENYVPGVEPKIFLEMIPANGVSPKVVDSVTEPSGRSGESRLAWRLFLVDDLDAAVALMASAAALYPSETVRDDQLAVDRARFSFAHPGSATIDIAEPHATGPARDYLDSNGPGVWLTGLQVADPEAVISAALERGAMRAIPDVKQLQHVIGHEQLHGALVAVEPFVESAAQR